MKKSVGIVAVAGLLTLSAIGCATIASGTTQVVSVSSNVDGAELYLDGEKIGTTPFNGSVSKGKTTLRVEATGYRNETLALSRSLDPAFWGNIIIGGTLGSITDFATGAAYQYAPASYQVELRSEGQPEEAFRQQLVVRKFAMVYIDEISRDVSAGGGEHLGALLDLMNDGESATVDARQVGVALEASRGFPTDFGDEVVDLI